MADYDFSSLYGLIIQTSGILIALVSVIALYRIDQISNYLIGLGKVVHTKKKYYIKRGYEMTDLYWDRLKGAIDIRSINGVEEIMIRLTAAEPKKGPTGFYKKTMPQWIEAKALLASIKWLYFISVVSLLIIIALSIIAIIINCRPLLFCYASIVPFVLNLYIVGRIIYKSFKIRLSYDQDKASECNNLRNNDFSDVDCLYKKYYKKRLFW